MRKISPYFITFALIVFILGVSSADAKNGPTSTVKTRIKADARYILRHTASVIQHAKILTRYQESRGLATKDYTLPTDPSRQLHGLEQAIEIQERAKDYYVQGMYQLSIDYSLDARIIAVRVAGDAAQESSRTYYRRIREKNMGNSSTNTIQSELDPREIRYWTNHQSSLLLDQEINGLGFKENETVPRLMEYDF